MGLLRWASLLLSAWAVRAEDSNRGGGGGGSPNITAGLGPLLSPHAAIYLPGSEGYINGSTRWSALDTTTVLAVVKVATEGDVQQTIKYANRHDIPFLAKGGGHGTNTNLRKAKNSIYIWTRGMADIKVAPDGNKAIIQAGAESGEVTKTLWNLGKQVGT